MKEEEKNAINFLQKLEFDEYEWWYDGEEYETREETENAFEKAQKIILNLVDKQQKEIKALELIHETYKEEIKSIEDRYISKDKIRDKIKELEELPNNQYIHLDYIKQEFKKLLEEN